MTTPQQFTESNAMQALTIDLQKYLSNKYLKLPDTTLMDRIKIYAKIGRYIAPVNKARAGFIMSLILKHNSCIWGS